MAVVACLVVEVAEACWVEEAADLEAAVSAEADLVVALFWGAGHQSAEAVSVAGHPSAEAVSVAVRFWVEARPWVEVALCSVAEPQWYARRCQSLDQDLGQGRSLEVDAGLWPEADVRLRIYLISIGLFWIDPFWEATVPLAEIAPWQAICPTFPTNRCLAIGPRCRATIYGRTGLLIAID